MGSGANALLLPEVLVVQRNRTTVAARPMPIGILGRRLPGYEADTSADTLRRAAASDFDGMLFPTPRDVSPELEPGELREVGAVAAELGSYLEFGLGFAGPHRDPDTAADELAGLIRAGRQAGCVQFLTVTNSDRRSAAAPHREQLAAVERTLRRLVPVLHELDCYLNLKTHEDLSSVEVLHLVEAVDDERLGVGLDVANLVVRGEDPVAATRRLAPWVRQAYLDDVALFFIDTGLRRKLLPCGAGVMDWPGILAELVTRSPVRTLTIEQHRGQFDVPIFDAAWFDAEPHLRPAEIAVLARMAWRTEQRVRAGEIPPLPELATPPAASERFRQFGQSAAYLRRVLGSLRSVPGAG
jgi:3-oxoisoapionate decarboxylase